MEKIKILGLGPGNLDYTLPIVLKKIEESDVIIGGKRHLESLGKYTKNKEYFYISPDLSKVIEFINENRDKKISLVVSGDTGFYSFLAFIKKHFCDNELEVVAGISSLQYMFAKISDFWNNAYISSVHGKNFDYVSKLREYEKIGLLTDFSKNTPQNIAKKLFENGFENAKIFVGENLSYENEKIYEFKVSKLKDYEKKFGINVVIIKR